MNWLAPISFLGLDNQSVGWIRCVPIFWSLGIVFVFIIYYGVACLKCYMGPHGQLTIKVVGPQLSYTDSEFEGFSSPHPHT